MTSVCCLACFSDVKYREMEMGIQGYFQDRNNSLHNFSKPSFVYRCCACARGRGFMTKAPNPIFPKTTSLFGLEQFEATVCTFKFAGKSGISHLFLQLRSFQRSIRIEVYSHQQRSVGAFKFLHFHKKSQKNPKGGNQKNQKRFW